MKNITIYKLVAMIGLAVTKADSLAAAAAAVAPPALLGNAKGVQASGIGSLTNPGAIRLEQGGRQKVAEMEQALRDASALEETLAKLKASRQKTQSKVPQLVEELPVQKVVAAMKTSDEDHERKAYHSPASGVVGEHIVVLKKMIGLGEKGEGAIQVSSKSVQELLGYAKDLKETGVEFYKKAKEAKTAAVAPEASSLVSATSQLKPEEVFDRRPRVKHCRSYVFSFDPDQSFKREISSPSPSTGPVASAHPQTSPAPIESLAPPENSISDVAAPDSGEEK